MVSTIPAETCPRSYCCAALRAPAWRCVRSRRRWSVWWHWRLPPRNASSRDKQSHPTNKQQGNAETTQPCPQDHHAGNGKHPSSDSGTRGRRRLRCRISHWCGCKYRRVSRRRPLLRQRCWRRQRHRGGLHRLWEAQASISVAGVWPCNAQVERVAQQKVHYFLARELRVGLPHQGGCSSNMWA
jgi:hypothetical protein